MTFDIYSVVNLTYSGLKIEVQSFGPQTMKSLIVEVKDVDHRGKRGQQPLQWLQLRVYHVAPPPTHTPNFASVVE